MGFFSWKTCDSKESISNVYSGRQVRTVYLLQPHGQKPLQENAYEGYGIFGGVNAHVWLAKANLDKNIASGMDDETLRIIGVYLSCGFDFYRDKNKQVYACSDEVMVIEALGLFDFPIVKINSYDEMFTVDGVSGTMEQHEWNGRLTKQTPPSIAYPLKFSFNENARYEAYSASEACDKQGYFYDD
ncbi:hypothetical protein ACFM0N_004155 [Vibrio parahaemolyticus]|uniref:hypothetical protein n=1 Tax=Vibrio TaxID=662 RepID=UPI001E10D86E|nr:hypothetical protein [Vibrio parahaemolyticus]